MKSRHGVRVFRLTRRQLLHAGLLTAAGLAAGEPLCSAGPEAFGDKMQGHVDAHSHIWTRDVDKFPLAKGQTLDDLDPPSFTAEELIQVASSERVNRVVLIQHHIHHGWDNSYVIDAAARHPDKFRVVGMINDLEAHPDVSMRKLLKQKVTAFRITSWIRGKEEWLNGPGMAAMWECGAETGQAMCCLIDPQDLIAVDTMCRKYPQTPVVIDHFARIGVDGIIREKDLERLCALAEHTHTYCKISAYYGLGKKKPPYLDLVPMIRRVYEAFGPERLMWASDSPYQLQGEHSYRASISLVRDRLDLFSKSDREWLLAKTAEKVYFYNS